MNINRFLGGLKRTVCVFLSSVLVLFAPVEAYVASASVTIAAGAYAILAILAACGILATSETFQALIGSWTSEAEYLARGASRQLGSYAQRIYDNARSGDVGIQETFVILEGALISAVCCNCGDTVEGIQVLAEDLKEFLRSCVGLTNTGAYIQVPTVPVDEVWGVTEWSRLEEYPLPNGFLTSPTCAQDPNYIYFLTVYALSGYGPDCMNIQKWYYYKTVDIFGFFDADRSRLTLYQRDAANAKYAAYSAPVYSAYVNSDGTLKYKTDNYSTWNRDWTLCTPADAGKLPFPVFTSMEDAQWYVSTGEVRNAYVSGTITMDLDGYRADVMDLAAGCIADVLTMPANAESGAEKLGLIKDVYPAGTIEDVQEAVKAGGIAIDHVTDVPSTGDVTLSDILSHVISLPGSIAKAIADIFTLTEEDAQEQLTVPEIISRKFPFCIPFDFAYLISTLAADPVAPRYVIPFHFDYDQWSFSYDFVIDLSSWEPLAVMIRLLMDILFCASLMLGTRALIRG